MHWHYCELCEYKCKFRYNLMRHMRCKHNYVKAIATHTCEYCSFKGITKSGLNIHMVSKHTLKSTKDAKCLLCFSVFHSNSELRKHTLSNHGNL